MVKLMKYYIGIDIGGTNTKLGLISQNGQVVKSCVFPTQSKDGFDIFSQRLNQEISQLREIEQIESIGIGAPNANAMTGEIIHPPNLDWDIVNLRSAINQVHDLPTYIDNDANIAAFGEKVFGKAHDLSDFIVITLGTGLGSGIFVNNQILRGPNNMAAEAGHLIVIPNGRPCGCGGLGHLETYVSVRGIKQTMLENTLKEMSFKEILESFEAGDPITTDVVKKTAYYLSLGLSQLHSLFMPQKFILTGGVSNLGEKFLKYTQENFINNCYPAFKHSSQIEYSEISLHDGSILGAAALAINKTTN